MSCFWILYFCLFSNVNTIKIEFIIIKILNKLSIFLVSIIIEIILKDNISDTNKDEYKDILSEILYINNLNGKKYNDENTAISV